MAKDRLDTHKLDDMDVRILELLAENPTAQNEFIRSKMAMEQGTLDKRLKWLKTKHYLADWQRLADLPATGQRLRYRIDIKINPRKLKKRLSAEDFVALSAKYTTDNPQKLLGYYIRDVIANRCSGIIVEEVSILLGDPADLCATVLVLKHGDIFDFITEHLRTLDEVENTSTSHVSWRVARSPELSGSATAQEPIDRLNQKKL